MGAKAVSLAIAAASVLVYWNTFYCGFVFDDHRAILTNDDLDASKTSVWGLFTNDFWGGLISRRESHKSYRPLTVLTYRYFNHYFSGLEPAGYHMVNLVLHAIASLLFLLVAEVALGTGGWWATYAALLFATHSVHTEAVASVVGRAEVLSSIFFLLSFLSYIKGIFYTSLHLPIKLLPRSSWPYIGLTVILSVFSLLSKEQGITVLGVCILFDLLIHWPLIWSTILGVITYKRGGGGEKGDVKSEPVLVNRAQCSIVQAIPGSQQGSFSSLLGRIGILLCTGVFIMWIRISLNAGSDPIFKKEEMRAAFHQDRSVRILSFLNIYLWNAWLLLNPSQLCCDWTLGSLPLVTTLYDVRNLLSLFLLTTLAILSLFTLNTASIKKRLGVGMGLSLLVVPFLPSSGLVFRVGFVIAERVLYLPSMGHCILVMIGAKNLAQTKYNMGKLVHIGVIFMLLVMSCKTFSRNRDWRTDLNLFEAGVKVNPNNVKLVNNYAMELKAAQRLEESRKHYLAALEMEPDYPDLYFNYGNLLTETGDHAQSAIFFEKALAYPQTYGKTLNNLATVYYRLKRYKEAEERFKESLERSSDQATTYNNLASLYGETKRFRESEEMFRKALKLHPTYVEAHFNLGTLLYQMGREEEAKQNLHRALELNPHHVGAQNNLKVIEYYQNKNKPK